MQKFTFKLHALLRQRTHVEQQRQRELAVRLKALADVEAELRRVRESVDSANNDMRQHHLTGALDLNFLAAHRRFLLAMERQSLAIVQKIAAAQQQVTDARKALADAATQRKIMEKLREKHHARWLAELNRKELAEIDEIGMQLSYRNLVDSTGNSQAKGSSGPITTEAAGMEHA